MWQEDINGRHGIHAIEGIHAFDGIDGGHSIQGSCVEGAVPVGDLASARSSRHCEILIVEDTPAVAETLAEILDDRGYTSVLAGTAEAALQHLRRRRIPDLILLDLVLPGLDGRAFLERLQRHTVYQKIPVIVVSALCATEDAPVLGVSACLTKPVVIDDLLAAVAECCRVDEVPEE